MFEYRSSSGETVVTEPSLLEFSSIFDVIAAGFASPSAWSKVLVQEGELGPGVPTAAVTAGLACDIVRGADVPDPVCQAVWSRLVLGSRNSQYWERVLLWSWVPRLRALTRRLHSNWRNDRLDIQSDVLLGFLLTARDVDVNDERLPSRLYWGTHEFAKQACRSATQDLPSDDIESHQRRLGHVAETDLTVVPLHSRPDSATVEGERIGALADRMGLRSLINTHNARPGEVA